MAVLPAPDTMLAYASILEKPRYYVHTDGIKYRYPDSEVLRAAAAALRHCAALR